MSQLRNVPFTADKNIYMPITALKTTSGTVTVDFLENDVQSITLSGSIVLSTLNLHAGLSKTLAITGGGSPFTITLPPEWVLLGGLTSPITLAAGKNAILSLAVIGTNDASANVTSAVWASYIVQS